MMRLGAVRQFGRDTCGKRTMLALAQSESQLALNAVCPYYTMFPLSFPLRIIASRGTPRGWVADPFCGRGTSNFAARLLGWPTIGVDSSPVAVAIAAAKLATTTAGRVVAAARSILAANLDSCAIPQGAFWTWAYHPTTLSSVCQLREALLRDCSSDTRLVLRAIMLGALHGPRTKHAPSHLSNQSPRTFAPKPAYAVRFWRKHGLRPAKVDVLEVIRVRAERFLRAVPDHVEGIIRHGDSRVGGSFMDVPIGLVVTSPPYYGMRTYVPDQWLRAWFLGGPSEVQYRGSETDVRHASPGGFISDLRLVWQRLAERATSDARMVVRFGGINDRKADHVQMLKESLADSGWRLRTVVPAGDADSGRRQALQFFRNRGKPKAEFDFHAVVA